MSLTKDFELDIVQRAITDTCPDDGYDVDEFDLAVRKVLRILAHPYFLEYFDIRTDEAESEILQDIEDEFDEVTAEDFDAALLAASKMPRG